MFEGQFWFMLVVLLLLAGVVGARGGADALGSAFGEGGGLLLRFGPVIVVSFLAAGLFQWLVPTEWVRENLGHEAGLRGILIATGAGMVTPAGPFVSMPIAAVLIRAGAAPPAVVAFLTAWSLLAMHRLVAWEIPILGLRFAAIRYGISLLLPVLAGLATRAIFRAP
ncbi:MAG: permease [Myxococcota bacterium]|nr:permease [Myxococcota bacterium]